MLPAVLERLLHDWSAVLFPARCLDCNGLFLRRDDPAPTAVAAADDAAPDFGAAMGGFFCLRCRERWTQAASPLCTRCGLVFKSRFGGDHLCGRCLDRPGCFAKARAAGIYDHSLRTAIHALKFGGRTALARPLGEVLWQAYRRHWPEGDIDVIAPVPLHRRRLRQRGFNQAYLLLGAWRPPAGTVIDRGLLSRTRDTLPQTGLDRDQRRRNIGRAFALGTPERAAGRRVLLVDDVLTTGATADACADVLLRGGAVRVDVLTLARAQ